MDKDRGRMMIRRMMMVEMHKFYILLFSRFTYQETFSTEDGAEGDVTVIWFTCSNAECTTVKDTPTSNLFSPNPKTVFSTSTFSYELPDCPEGYGYLVSFFMEGYRSRLSRNFSLFR